MSRDDDLVWEEVVRALREYFACEGEDEDERTTKEVVGGTMEGREDVRDEKGMSCKGTGGLVSGGGTSAEDANCASTTNPRLLNGNVDSEDAMTPAADWHCSLRVSTSTGTIAAFRLCAPFSVLVVMCFRLCFVVLPKLSSFRKCLPFANGGKGEESMP
jgi:hypothetical protein